MTTRADTDRCPGVLRPHQAVDGAVLRVRIPGGRIPAAALQALSAASTEYADGHVQLTSRANLQLRGVRTTDDGAAVPGLVDDLDRAGLLPHPTHERVRNVLCSPLTGLVGGLADLRPLIGRLDTGLSAAAELAELPGPFLFALDDGRGDVGARADLVAVAVSCDRARIRTGDWVGPVIALDDVVPTLLDLARRFLATRPPDRPVWHVRELPEAGRELMPGGVPVAHTPGDPAPLGAIVQNNGRVLVSVLAPLGRLTAPAVTALAEAATELIVTPWRGVLVPDVPAGSPVLDQLTGAGLVTDAGSPWRGVTACSGLRCACGSGDAEALAFSVVAESERSAQLPVHVVACSRACGRPARRHVLATVGHRRVEIRWDQGVVDESLTGAAAVIAADRAGR